MKKISSNPILILALAGFLAVFFSACEKASSDDLIVSTLTRPVAVAVAVLDWEPLSDSSSLGGDFDADDPTTMTSWSQCYWMRKRPFAFVANSGSDSVARIDLCSGEIENHQIKGNPYVVSHIPVGRFPVDVAVSADKANSRVFVSNSGESTLSIIDAAEARALQRKVELPARPNRLTVIPAKSQTMVFQAEAVTDGDADTTESQENTETTSQVSEDPGDVYVAMPEVGKLGRIVRSRAPEDGEEAYRLEEIVELKTTLTPEPLPGGMAYRKDAKTGQRFLYVADMKHSYFHIVDLDHPSYPARVRMVYGPQRDCSISEDGRFLYLARMDTARVVVWDLQKDRYVDTNKELPSHWNSPAPSSNIDYDIKLQSIPRRVLFAKVAKTELSPADGDTDTVDSEENGEVSETSDKDQDGDADTASETDTDLNGENENAETAEYEAMENMEGEQVEVEAADQEQLESETETENDSESSDDRKQFAYSIGYNGVIQVIDVFRDFHKLYDADPATDPSWTLLDSDELTVDNNFCLAALDVKFLNKRVPDSLWELKFNALIPDTDASVSGLFKFKENRFEDPSVDFTAFSTQILSKADLLSRNDTTLKPDRLVIKTTPKEADKESLGCPVKTVSLEILDVGQHFLTYDPAGLDLTKCYNTAVEYSIRSNGNYLVFMTELDSAGNRLTAPAYKGRASNAEFYRGSAPITQDKLETLSFEADDWRDYLCEYPLPDDQMTTYGLKEDLSLKNGSKAEGIRCRNPWTDGEGFPVSFQDDNLRFSVCLDIGGPIGDAASKIEGSYEYDFKVSSGMSSDMEITLGTSVNNLVGMLLEDAALLDYFPKLPRMYVVDSSLEIVYVLDLATDTAVGYFL